MKYIVVIDYKKFEFVDKAEAVSFATMAKQHELENYDVEIKLKADEPIEEEKGEE